MPYGKPAPISKGDLGSKGTCAPDHTLDAIRGTNTANGDSGGNLAAPQVAQGTPGRNYGQSVSR